MSNSVLLSDATLDIEAARNSVTSPTAGAISMFIGTVAFIFSPHSQNKFSPVLEFVMTFSYVM